MNTAPIICLHQFPELRRLLPSGWLRSLGVYGYDAVEDVILSALVTGDPLLLIGKAGTGKTFLLNSLSEALGIEHRHYNASLIAFDDLVGFPYPTEDGKAIRYIETPDQRLLKQLRALGEEIHVLVSAHGSREVFEAHSIPCTALPQVQQPANNRS
jgi:hypothetical protein